MTLSEAIEHQSKTIKKDGPFRMAIECQTVPDEEYDTLLEEKLKEWERKKNNKIEQPEKE